MADVQMIPEGRWEAVPAGAALGETKTGKDQLGIAFDIPALDRSITGYFYFTEDTAKRTMQALRTCGWVGDDLCDLSSVGTDPELRVQLVIKHEEYEGKWQAKVAFVNPTGGVALQKPLDQGRKVALAQRMRGLAMETAKSAAQRQAPRGNGAAPVTGHLDDDVPF